MKSKLENQAFEFLDSLFLPTTNENTKTKNNLVNIVIV